MRSALLIGAGNRGQIFARYARKHGLRLCAVADPDEHRRSAVARMHDIPAAMQFAGADEALSRPQMADGAIIATMDSLHEMPARKALEHGYHVMLEKPMALSADACRSLVELSQSSQRYLLICHVLRYTKFFRRIKTLLSEGIIGPIASLYHSENITPFHMAHSYVRGNWNRASDSSPIILAKCSHDLDLICWFTGARPVSVSSTGGTSHFRPENRPQDAADRCVRCSVDCPHDARRLYLEAVPILQSAGLSKTWPGFFARLIQRAPVLKRMIPGMRPWSHWPTTSVTNHLHELRQALETGPYGMCVYAGENDQPDHQEAWIQFENGVSAAFRFHGFSPQEGRTLRIDGSLGSLRASTMGGGSIEVILHSGRRISYPETFSVLGHAEGDEGALVDFIRVLEGKQGEADAGSSLESHLIAFAAEESRRAKGIVQTIRRQ